MITSVVKFTKVVKIAHTDDEDLTIKVGSLIKRGLMLDDAKTDKWEVIDRELHIDF